MYILSDDNECLIIECGRSFLEAEKALDFNTKKVKGVLISHEHGDHAMYIDKFIEYFPVYASAGTLKAKGVTDNVNARAMRMLKPYQIGTFKVLAFRTQHDAVEPCGFLIQCPDGSKLVFATDTYYIRYTFRHIRYWMIECNYDKKKLNKNVEEGLVHPCVAKRVRRSHMSLDECINMMKSNDMSETRMIMLIHLSSDNSDRDYFVSEISKVTGRYVIAAERQLNIELP